MNVSIDEFAAAVVAELAAYDQDVTDGMKKSIKNAAKVCVSELKRSSPKNTGFYAYNWRQKKVYESAEDMRVFVYNENAYQLTHLLEYGHALVTGGRAPAHPHIAQAEEKASEVLEQDIKIRLVSRG